jgi:hypothetical protein
VSDSRLNFFGKINVGRQRNQPAIRLGGRCLNWASRRSVQGSAPA